MKTYVTEITNVFDVSIFQEISAKLITPEWLRLSDPESLQKFTDKFPVDTNEYPELLLLRKKYPSLSRYIKFMKSTKGSWPVHIDNHRHSAINIPISNTANTITRFYVGGTPVDKVHAMFGDVLNDWYSNEYLTYIKDAQKQYDHVLTIPTLVNTAQPHNIINNSDTPRIVCSWATSISYKDAQEEFNV
jgi:hypothetical protein